MCGIYMVSQEKSIDSGKKVFAGLKKIEYRGYDSWGVVVATAQNGLVVKKRVGKLSKAKNVVFAEGLCALGHTRWATHGGVTQENAHPHLAKSGKFVLAQNGVVENFQDLKELLLDWGYAFESQTDTEVIVGLLELELEKQQQANLSIEIVQKVFTQLSGRNTIAILTNSGELFAVRDGSPLVVGRNTADNTIYFSSDVISLNGEVQEYTVIQSGQIVSYQNKKLRVLNMATGTQVNPEFTAMNLEQVIVDKQGYSSFMLKEIHEQAVVLSKVVAGKKARFTQLVSAVKSARRIFTLGAGTAHFAALHAAYLLRKSGLTASAIASYEADSYKQLFDAKTLCIVFSQSGETADTNEVVEWMKEKGVKIASVVNMPASTLTQLSDYPFMLDVGPELAVASTKAFFGQVIWAQSLSALLCKQKFEDIQSSITAFEQSLSVWFTYTKIQEKIKKLAISLARKKHLFVLARGDMFVSSLESALKLKEISYIHAEGFSGGELKHGVIALIEKATPVLCLVGEDENKANMLSAIAEINARGGYTIVVASKDNELYKEWIEVPELQSTGINFMTLASIVPSQLLTCYMAMQQGHDVDKPRNLAKSVTVK